MEFIAEAVHASIDLTQTDCHETVNDPSRPSLSCSSPSVPTAVDQPHPAGLDIDSYPTAFHRPENVQHPPAVFTSHNAEPPLEHTSLEPVSNVEVEKCYDDMIANGMRVMHFMDRRPFDVFHHQQQYPSHYFPGTQYSPGYCPPVGGLASELYSSISAPTTSSFSPHIIVPQPVYYSNSSQSNSSVKSFGFQAYQSNHTEKFDDSNVIRRKGSNDSDTSSDEQYTTYHIEMPPCSVCGDISCGIHYGAVVCEGCKGFFRRANLRNPEESVFICFNNSTCIVNRSNRNKCRACRLRRCYEVGMDFGDGSEFNKRRRRNRFGQLQDPLPPPIRFRPRSMPSSDVLECMGFVVAAQSASFTTVSEIFASRYAAVLSLSPEQLWPPGGDLSNHGYQAIQHFAYSLPFISHLPPDLRTYLLETNALDVMILRLTFRFCSERDSFLFPTGAEVTKACLSSTLLGSTTVNRLANLGRLVFRLGIGSDELAFLSTLALLSPDALNDGSLHGHATMLRDIVNKVLQAFQYFVRQRWSTRPFFIGKLVALLSDIRALQYSVAQQTWLEPTGYSSHSA